VYKILRRFSWFYKACYNNLHVLVEAKEKNRADTVCIKDLDKINHICWLDFSSSKLLLLYQLLRIKINSLQKQHNNNYSATLTKFQLKILIHSVIFKMSMCVTMENPSRCENRGVAN
jgi:hypothetical protein